MQASIAEIEAEFLRAMEEAGIVPASSFILSATNGEVSRFHITGDKPGSKNGAYCLYLDDHPAGWFKTWKDTGSSKPVFWKFGGGEISNEERKRLVEAHERSRQKRNAEMKKRAEAAAQQAIQIWEDCSDAAPKDSKYLQEKKVKPLGIREVRNPFQLKSSSGKDFTVRPGTLVVPLWSFSCKKIVSLQFITDDGNKFFLPGGKASDGWFCPLGDLKKEEQPVCVCEGWATGSTITEISKLPVVCAMNVGNLGKVLKNLRELYPLREIIIAADNDHNTEGNPGVTEAKKVAEEYSCLVAFPDFDDGDDGTDWNDLRVSKGQSEAVSLWLQKTEESRFEMSTARHEIDELGPENECLSPGIRSDVSNARLLVSQHGKNLRFCHAWKDQGWLIWNGRLWQERMGHMVTNMSIQTIESMLEELNAIYDEKERDKLEKFIQRSLSAGGISSMKRLAQDLPSIPVCPEEFDANPWLVNCMSGTIDLKKKVLKRHTREDLITKIAPVAFDPKATCPEWEAFLNTVMGGSSELISYLQRSIGYSLTGSTEEHCLFVLYGTGRNGKSTFLNTIKAMMGDYARQAASDAFMAKRSGSSGPSDEIAALRGARFVTAIETDEGQRLAEALVKQLTGGDSVTVRRLYENFFEYKPEFKLFLATNHKPKIRGTDPAIWRRIRLVPFTVTIPDEDVDPELPGKLQAELPGIFAWAVRGAFEWAESGMGMPKEILEATQEYRSEMDVVGKFLEECCVIGADLRVLSARLYKEYSTWCEDSGERRMTKNALGRRLSERGMVQAKGAKGRREWVGIGLLDDDLFRSF